MHIAKANTIRFCNLEQCFELKLGKSSNYVVKGKSCYDSCVKKISLDSGLVDLLMLGVNTNLRNGIFPVHLLLQVFFAYLKIEV